MEISEKRTNKINYKRAFFIAFVFIILSSPLLYSQFSSAGNDNPIQISVSNITAKKLPEGHNLIGVNMFDDNESNRNFLGNPAHIKELANMLSNLNINILRYPGGINATAFFWDVPNADIFSAFRKLSEKQRGWLGRPSLKPQDRMGLKTFLEFCKQNNIKAIIQVNTHSLFDKKTKTILTIKQYGNDNSFKIINAQRVKLAAKSAAELVKWVQDNNYEGTVAYWELGNEDYSGQFLGAGYSGKQYAQVAAEFTRQMKKANPNIKLILTNEIWGKAKGAEYMNNWTKNVLKAPEMNKEANNINALALHSYKMGVTKHDKTYETFKTNIYKNFPGGFDTILDYHADVRKEAGFPEKPVFITEFNYNDLNHPYSHTWLGAVGVGKLILSCANLHPCYHADFHQIYSSYGGINKGFGLLHYAKKSQYPFIAYPSAYVLAFMNKNIKENVLKTSINTDENIYATASKQGEKVRVVIVNMEKLRVVKLKMSGFNGKSGMNGESPKYIGNKSLGVGVREDFTVLDRGDSSSEPSEIRLMNVLNDSISLWYSGESYTISLPANTITSLEFET